MENRKNLCAMIPEALHTQARTEQEQMNLTLSQYVEMVLKEHFENGGKKMANGTTSAEGCGSKGTAGGRGAGGCAGGACVTGEGPEGRKRMQEMPPAPQGAAVFP